jgi:hypothetical protein
VSSPLWIVLFYAITLQRQFNYSESNIHFLTIFFNFHHMCIQSINYFATSIIIQKWKKNGHILIIFCISEFKFGIEHLTTFAKHWAWMPWDICIRWWEICLVGDWKHFNKFYQGFSVAPYIIVLQVWLTPT